MLKLVLNETELLTKLDAYTVQDSDEWATQLKHVDISDAETVTVIDGFEGDIVELAGVTYRFNSNATLVRVITDDTSTGTETEIFYGSIDVAEAIDFANKMIALLSN